jgi:hypothetical protein
MFARRVARVRVVAAALFAATLFVTAGAHLSAADFYQMNRHTLANYRFEGVGLGATPAELKRHLPEARFDYDKADAQVGVTAYAIGPTESADSACFYFQHDRLYQIDIEYKKPRVEEMGGAAVIMDHLMAAMGPPDYADFFRRTWYQPACSSRADFWVTDDVGMLVITDTSRNPRADDRLHETHIEPRLDLGFPSSVEQSAAR